MPQIVKHIRKFQLPHAPTLKLLYSVQGKFVLVFLIKGNGTDYRSQC